MNVAFMIIRGMGKKSRRLPFTPVPEINQVYFCLCGLKGFVCLGGFQVRSRLNFMLIVLTIEGLLIRWSSRFLQSTAPPAKKLWVPIRFLIQSSLSMNR